MSQFKYTLPSGATFTLEAPEGTTQAEADYIFYSQVASGTLVGFAPGQSIGGAPSAAVKFALSRLERGTAGVDDIVVLSITSGIPTISGSIPNLINVPLENPITQADFVNINADNTFAPTEIGPLNVSQVQGLMAQVANFTSQQRQNQGIITPTINTTTANQTIVNQITGIGIYGLFCEQLEQAGYVKPGTYLRFIAIDPNDFVSTMNSPGIWTGLNGIYSLDEFLISLSDQNSAQLTLMRNGYESLTATGVITPPATQPASAMRGYVYTQSGLQTISAVSAATGIAISVPTTSGLSAANTPLANLLSTPLTNPGSLATGASNLTNLSPAITSALKNTITGDIGALVANASKFGTNLATSWAKSVGLGDITKLTNLNLGSLPGNLTSLLPPNLAGLAANIQNLDVLGKASQFASTFSNPLTSLSNLGNFNLSSLPSLSSLTAGLPGLSSLGNLGNLSNLGSLSSLTSAIPGLSNLASLGNFSSLANFGGLGSLGSLGGLFGGGGDSLVSATKVAAGFTNTVSRSVVNTAFTRILGSSKIPVPQFDYIAPGSASLNASADITAAQNFLQGLRTQGSQLLGSAANIFG